MTTTKKIGKVFTAKTATETTQVTEKTFMLSLEISQSCEVKRSKKDEKGIKTDWVENYSVSPYKMLLQSSNDNKETLGKLLGTEIYKFFQLLQLQKDFKQNKFKLNKPINLKIDYWVNEKNYSLKVTNDIQLKFSGDNAPHKFASFLFASLLINVAKENNTFDVSKVFELKPTKGGYYSTKNLSIFSEQNKSLLLKMIDGPLCELETLILN